MVNLFELIFIMLFRRLIWFFWEAWFNQIFKLRYDQITVNILIIVIKTIKLATIFV